MYTKQVHYNRQYTVSVRTCLRAARILLKGQDPVIVPHNVELPAVDRDVGDLPTRVNYLVVCIVPGILLTAVLLVRATGSLLTGPTRDRAVGFTDLRLHEVAPVAGLLALSVLVGLLPGPLLAWITPAAQSLVVLVGR